MNGSPRWTCIRQFLCELINVFPRSLRSTSQCSGDDLATIRRLLATLQDSELEAKNKKEIRDAVC